MIISHKHKFIFIKTVKTAGTSIEVDLNKILGPDDIATPVIPAVKGHKPQNFSWRMGGLFRRKLYNHMSARKARSFVGKDIFNDYFVFCVEREPVDKCISHFCMMKNSPVHNRFTKNITIDKYIARKRFPIDTAKYTDRRQNLIVDRILRYETIADEIQEVGKLLGFQVTLKSRAKAGFREDLKLSAAQKNIIYQTFKSSNLHTGYKL